jgi:hypothetical protein
MRKEGLRKDADNYKLVFVDGLGDEISNTTS